MTPSEVAAALRQVRGVGDAEVLFAEPKPGEKKVIAYVVPDTATIETLLAETEEEHKQLRKWRKTFDLMQFGKEASAAPMAFNIAGWNSSYTRQPIPPEEMREWVEETVRSIKILRPQEVLEIGCGTGLLLLRIAPSCRRYVGTDFSPAVLKRVREQMSRLDKPLEGVTLLERSADNFEGCIPGSFDTVIVNSVIQYFPGLTYLLLVLEKLVSLVKPGGRIFLGDLRSLPLLEVYALSVELFQAPASMTLGELRGRVRKRIQNQSELLLSPSFFLALQKRLPEISRVEVRPKRGRTDNELTRFRFNAVLSVGAENPAAIAPSWMDWPAAGLAPAMIRQRLEDPKCTSLALRGVPNVRVESELTALRAVGGGEGGMTVGKLRSALQESKTSGVHPTVLFALAEESGFSLDWSCLNSRSDGAFDLLFDRKSTSGAPPFVSWPMPAQVSAELTEHCSNPRRSKLGEALIQALTSFSVENLPQAVRPAEFVLVESLPATFRGQIDLGAHAVPGTVQS